MSWAAKYAQKRTEVSEPGRSPVEPRAAFGQSGAEPGRNSAAFMEPPRNRQRLPLPEYKPKQIVPAPLLPSIDSTTDFPTLGGAKTTEQKALPKQTGFASLAKAWAQQDADQQAQEEAERAEEERRMKRRAYEEATPDIYSARLRNQLTYRSQLNEPYDRDYDEYDRPYTPQYGADETLPSPPKDEWSHVEK